MDKKRNPAENRNKERNPAESRNGEKDGLIRINKYLSEAGVCSRREADRLLMEGRITVDGRKASTGERITADSCVCVDGRPVKKEEKKVLLLFHKPKGIVCSTRKQREETTVTEYLDYPIRIYPIGRLDKESEGLLLLTNQGELVNKIMRAGNYHEKEYLVTVDKPIDQGFLRRMAAGVPILDTVTRPCFVEKTGKKSFRIILTQGLNRHIRRMCEYFGYHVLSLKRVRIMNLTLSGLGEGEYREITKQEWKELEQAIAASSSETVIESGGHHGQHLTANERADRKAGQSGKGVLSGRPGNHEQSGVRPPLRRTGGAGAGDRHRSRKQSHYKSGV